MFLGIEIGGTKLQLGIGSGQGGSLEALEQRTVDPSRGAAGIREQIHQIGGRLIDLHAVAGVGIGFGGPVDGAAGRTIHSFHIDGWDDFPLVEWCQQALGRPAVLGNDSDLAGLAEARFGAGRGNKVVLYSNVGTGIGGALVIDGELYPGGSGIACEIGHLRPGLENDTPEQIVEALASGWGLAAAARARLHDPPPGEEMAAADLLRRCHDQPETITGKLVAEAALANNLLASEVYRNGLRAYGWALAQAITLLGPNVVVIGGGVASNGEARFLEPLRTEVEKYVYRPLRGKYRIAAAELAEEVVIHGALALAAAGRS